MIYSNTHLNSCETVPLNNILVRYGTGKILVAISTYLRKHITLYLHCLNNIFALSNVVGFQYENILLFPLLTCGTGMFAKAPGSQGQN